MTITLQAVNELIAYLESAGEPSIREQKFLKLAKAFKQLAAENVGIDGFVEDMLAIAWQGGSADGSDIQEIALRYGLIQLEVYCADKHENCVYDPGNFDDGDAVYFRTETPATDRIVAGIKADGVGEFIGRLQQHVDEGDFVGDEVAVIVGAIDCGKEFCEQLREGAK
ncbi:TPA: hypothetical protein PIV86_004117 [Klebsiella quasipneumoniae subsp. similipneumoniae]|nr:hypothetical protein [Klebsiella quasipneumoniae subsp. similipneumoniae]